MSSLDSLRAEFIARFSASPRFYRAPGRVNLIGEHTDYNLGFVLPVALDLECRIAAEPSGDGKLHLASAQEKDTAAWTVADIPKLKPQRHWTDYVIGVAQQLAGAGFELQAWKLDIS